YSWKEGVRVASGAYVAFLDCDDWVDGSYLKELARGIQDDTQIVCCNYNKVFSDRQILQTEYVGPGFYNREQIYETIFPVLLNDGRYLSRGISPHRCGKLFSKQLLMNNLQYADEQITYGEDLNIFFAVMMDCHKILILDDRKGLYFYRQNEQSIIYTYKKAMFLQISLLRKKLFEIMDHKKIYDFSEQLNADFWCLFLEYLKNETKSDNLRLASREVCSCFRESWKEIPFRNLKLKTLDYVVMLCLRYRLYTLVYIWMVLYHFVKKR
ncbi:MAG: glycosyltransferase, partial [Anaerotignum sp.]|nr:glycosyltransferase [Anaerotignum sp.]